MPDTASSRPLIGTRIRNVPASSLKGDFPARPTGWPYRDPYSYIAGKRVDDAVPGGLWRIDDKLYDLKDFEHPGGREFIDLTKGTDITELFYTHHLDFAKVEKIIPPYEVSLKDVAPHLDKLPPRNSPFTFDRAGFYCTLRDKIWSRFGALKSPSSQPRSSRQRRLAVVGLGSPWKTLLFSDSLALLHFALLALAATRPSVMAAAKVAVALGMLNGLFIGIGHNFLHQKDSYRRHYMDLCGYSSADFRMHHLLSHHPYTNTVLDAELNQWLPEISFFPAGYDGPVKTWTKSSLRSFLLFSFILPLGIPKLQLHRFFKIVSFTYQAGRRDWLAQLLPVLQVVVLSRFGARSLEGVGLWLLMLTTSSAFFLWPNYLLGPHFNDECWHQGDVLDSSDWGLLQVQTNVERRDLSQKDRLLENLNNIPTFNMHHLHHLFPTIDATELSQVAPIFDKHCEDWAVKFEMMSYPELARGLWRCLGQGYVPNERPRNGVYGGEEGKQGKEGKKQA